MATPAFKYGSAAPKMIRTGGEGGQPPPDQLPASEMADMARDYIASLPASEFPNLVALADQFAVSDNQPRFELLLDIYVDGLARRIALERGLDHTRADRAGP